MMDHLGRHPVLQVRECMAILHRLDTVKLPLLDSLDLVGQVGMIDWSKREESKM